MKLRRKQDKQEKRQAKHAFISPAAYRDAITARDEATVLAEERLSTIGRLCGQLSDARDENTALRRQLDAAQDPNAGWLAERRDLRRQVLVLTQDRARLADINAELQAANEAMCKDAVDAAGTLTKKAVLA